MPDSTSTSWHLIENQATAQLAGRQGQLDLRRPESGFLWQGPQQQSLQLLRLHDRLQCPELSSRLKPYIREEDLIVNYGDREMLPFNLQIYWRRRSYPAQKECNVMDWILAMQTDCLGDKSHLNTSTTGSGANEILHLPVANEKSAEVIHSNSRFSAEESTGCILVRLGKMSYIELIHPRDFLSVEIEHSKDQSEFGIQRSIFNCHLEKGVIVRARLQGLCVPRENDASLMRTAYQAFLQHALPLTT